MDWPDKGGHKGCLYHAVCGCWIVRAALVAALPGRISPTHQINSDGVLVLRPSYSDGPYGQPSWPPLSGQPRKQAQTEY